MKSTTLTIGSVSEGTLRPEDLIPTFIRLAESITLTKAERQQVNGVRLRFNTRTSFIPLATEYFAGPEAPEDLDEMFSILSNHVPAFCYFGAHEGDGSDFGVWPSPDVFESDDEVFRSAEPPTDTSYHYWLATNDHGNATLYRRAGRRWIQVWSVV